MKTQLQNKLSEALLKGSPFSQKTAGSAVINPVSEMPMILTLDQLQPNPDNPRTGRNPRYDEIKNSIRQRGLDSVPKVTQAPGSNVYIFSDGGNTRYQILSELWQETQDERFYRLHVLFKPWPGRLQCVIGHLAENEVRGELTFLEKAQGISTLRTLYEEQQGKKLTLRALAQCITADGLPISISHISKMEDTVSGLLPYMPRLLNEGLGRHQIEALLSLRSTLKKVSTLFPDNPEASDTIDVPRLIDCFNETCRHVDTHDYFVFDVFVDELIGQLLRECPLSEFDYDRWIFELKVNKGKLALAEEIEVPGNLMLNREVTEVTPLPVSSETTRMAQESALPDPANDMSDSNDKSSNSESVETFVEIQDDLYGGEPVLSGNISPHDNNAESNEQNEATISSCPPVNATEPEQRNFPLSCTELWPMLTLTDDIEHLQVQAYRTLFELSSELDLSAFFITASGVYSPGFIAAPGNSALSLIMSVFSKEDTHLDDVSVALKRLLTGGSRTETPPLLNDTQFLMWMKLMYTLRCLFALQRNVEPDLVDDDAEFE
ncbi:chromosome partitioning protein ParB [Morganella morganii]|nr:chromosome partitioning protein ParB [Morganella morganii]